MTEGKVFSEVSRLLPSLSHPQKTPIFVGLLRNWEHLVLGTQNLAHFKVKSYNNFRGWEWERKCPKKMKTVWRKSLVL